MAEQDVFEFSAKYDVEIEKSSMDQACKVLDNFYNKYHDRKMKVNTSEMVKAVKDGVSKIQQLYKQGMDSIAKDDMAWFDVEDGLEDQLKSAKSKLEKFFNEAKIMFSDGSMISALDDNISDILSDKFTRGITATVTSLEEPVQHIKDLISGALQYIDAFNNVRIESDGVRRFTAFQEDMSTDGLEKHIELLKELIVYQKQLELISGDTFKRENAPLGNTTRNVENQVAILNDFLSKMKLYNAKVEEQYQLTTDQFKKRQQILSNLSNNRWDEDNQARAIMDAEEDGNYDYYISTIKRYIDEKKNAIQQLNELQSELFRADDLSKITSEAQDQISQYEKFIEKLESKRDSKIDIPIDFSEVVSALNGIKDAIREIKEAFDPLTQAFANEESALHSMVTANVSQLDELVSKFKEVHTMIDSLNKKEFNVNQIFNTKTTAKAQSTASLSLYKEKAEATIKAIEELYTQISRSKHIGKVLFGEDKQTAFADAFLGLGKQSGSFNPATLLGNVFGAETLKDIKNVLGKLERFKTLALQAASTINNLDAGSIDVSAFSAVDAIDSQINAIQSGVAVTAEQAKEVAAKAQQQIEQTGDAKIDSENIVGQIKALGEQVGSEFVAIRQMIETTFDFSTINPNVENVQSITEKIYQQFVELQDNIRLLEFTIESPEFNDESIVKAANAIKQEGEEAEKAASKKREFVEANKNVAIVSEHTAQTAEDAANGIKEEGNSAEIATPKKNAFTAANQKLADSMKETGDVGKVAVDGIKAEADAVDDAAKRVSKSSKKIRADQDIIVDKYKNLYGGDGRVNPNLASKFNKVLDTAGIDVSSIKASFGLKTEKDKDKNIIEYDYIKLIAEGTDALGKATTETREYEVATGKLINKIASFKEVKDNFNISQEVENANSKVAELEKRMGSFKIDLTAVRNAASGITDNTSLEIFEKELDAANQKLKELKATLKSSKSLDPVVNSESMMSNLEKTVETYRESIKKFSDVEGFKELESHLTNITTHLRSFNNAKELGNGKAMAEAVAETNKEIAKYNAQLNLVKARYQENSRVAKESEQARKKALNEEKVLIKEIASEDKLTRDKDNQLSLLTKQQAQWEKNGQLTDEVRAKINAMFDSLVKVTDAEELKAWKQQWSTVKNEILTTKYELEATAKAQHEIYTERKAARNYWDKEFQYSLNGLITPEKRPELEQLKAYMLQQAEVTQDAVEERYNALMTIVSNKNNALQKLMSAKGQNEKQYWQDEYSAWFGAWNALDQNKISEFFSDAGNQAMLGADKVGKFNDELERSKILSARSKDKEDASAMQEAEQLRKQELAAEKALIAEEKSLMKEIVAENKLMLDKDKQFALLSKQQAQWNKNGQLTDEISQTINSMLDSLARVTSSDELAIWKKQWSIVKDEVLTTKYEIEAATRAQKATANERKASGAYWDKEFKYSLNNIITPEKRPELEQLKVYMLQQAESTESAVKEQYDAIFTIIKNKNNALQQLMSAKGPNDKQYWQDQYSAWFGAWNKLDKDVVNNFFADTGNQAILGADKIDKFNDELERSEILSNKIKDQKYNEAQKEQDKSNKEKQKYGQTDYNRLNKFSESLHASIRELQDSGSISTTLDGLVAEFDEAYTKIEAMRKQFNENPASVTDDMKMQFQDSIHHADGLRQKIAEIFKESQKVQKLGNLIVTDNKDVSNVDNLAATMIEFANSTWDGQAKIQGFNEKGDQMYVTLNQGAGAVENITVALNKATGHLQAFTTGTSKVTNEWEDFKDKASAGAKNLIGMYVGFQEGVQTVRTGINYVKEIDLAMTELKKVTDETDATYKEFLSNAGDASAIIGSTIRDFTEATATFARLGYSIEEASSMAETAIIYKNVADGLDSVEESSDSIISTMMAFGIEADDTMSIIDRFNAVGNNFAITSAGIGEALQRSASALYEAGNTIDESVALVTAANSVIQNPEQVGTALKTLSLRIRGVKTELEDAGLETEGMAETTAQLQAKLLALTNGKVDIMLNADEFKSTTQILREMASVWEEMTDVQQAAALELLGGKRQANILSSLLTNFETVEDVIETSMNSAGSAMAENEKWLDSIEGKTYQFTNALQTLWSNMIDSEAIKVFLDFGTDAIQFLDTGAGKVVAFAAALKLMAKFKGFSIAGIAKGLGDTIKDINTAQQTLQSLKKVMPGAEGLSTQNIQAYANAVASLTPKYQAQMLAAQGLTKQQIKLAMQHNKVGEEAIKEATAHVYSKTTKEQEAAASQKLFVAQTQGLAISYRSAQAKLEGAAASQAEAAAKLLETAASKNLSNAELYELVISSKLEDQTKQEIIAKLGLAAANTTVAASAKGIASTIGAIISANPVGFIITVISAVGMLINAVNNAKKKITEAAREAEDAIKSLNDEFRSNAKTVTDYAERFAELAQGVDMLTGKNLSLTADDYEEFLDLSNQLAEIFPTLSRNYDENGNAIVQLSGDTDTMVGSLKQLLDVQGQISNQQIADNLPDLYKGVKAKSDSYRDEITDLESQLNALKEHRDDIMSDSFNLELGILSVTNINDREILSKLEKDYLGLLRELDLSYEFMSNEVDMTGFHYRITDFFNGFMSEEEIAEAKLRISAGINQLAKTYASEISNLNSQVQTTINENEANWSSLSSAISAWLSTDSTYQVLNDDMQSMVQTIINNLDYSSLDFNSWEKAQKWIKKNIVDIFTDPEIKESTYKELLEMFNFQSLFNSSNINLGEYKEQLSAFVDFIESLGLDKEVKDQLLKMFDIDIEKEGSLGKQIDAMIANVQKITKDRFGDKILTLDYSDLQIINSDKFNVDGSTIYTWKQLQEEIQEARNLLTKDFTTDSFKDYAESISAISSNISTYQEALENLESGKFTITDFMSLIEQFPELADGVDVSSKSFNGLSKNLRKAIRNSPDDLVDDLKDLREQLVLAGKSTDNIDQLIESIENMPTDAVKSLSDEFITLADKINEAKIAHAELQEAMSENPNEGYETRGEAMEQMMSLMGEGKIGSESELWSIAEAYGFTYDSAKTINENADALANFIAIRQEWYKTDDDGNYTIDGTESFLNDVEKVVENNKRLQELGVKWEYDDNTGTLDFDFNNANWDEVVSILAESKELAGLTSEEFYDLLMQVGQFFDIKWQDAEDLVWYLNQINQGTESAAENFESSKNAVASFLESSGQSVEWLDKKVEDLNNDGIIDITVTDEFKNLPTEVQAVLEEYYELKAKFEEDPLSISWQLDKNTGDKLNEDSIKALSQLTTILKENKSDTVFLDYTQLEDAAKSAGYADDAIADMIARIKEYNNVCGITTSNEDPLGLISLKEDAVNTERYLNALQIQFETIKNADNTVSYQIDIESATNILAARGWNATAIQAYLTTLQTENYSFTLDGAEIDVSTEAAQTEINNLVEQKENLGEEETTVYTVSGDGEAVVDHIATMWESITGSKSTTYSIYETTYRTVKVKTESDGITYNAPSTSGGPTGLRSNLEESITVAADGTAHAQGSWGAPKTETALVGELGPEMLVRNGRWTTVGDNGAEFTQIKKGDIIFNHKQTEDLLSKGYVTGRGKLHGSSAFASGTAYVNADSVFSKYTFDGKDGYTKYDISNAANSLSGAAGSISDAADEFREVFDWIEVRLEEINESIELRSAKLENAVGYTNQNAIVDDMLALNQRLYENLVAGANKYYEYAKSLLAKIPSEYHQAAQDGTIAIEEFVGEVDEKTLEAIQDYRDWVQKGADATQQAEETLTEISNLAKQAIDNITQDFENKTSLNDSRIEQLEAYNSLLETDLGFESENIYNAIIKANNDNITKLKQQREQMQAELNAQVEAGNIEKYSQNWYDAINEISAVDTKIIELTVDTEDYQDAINELHWDKFDALLGLLEAVSNEADNLIDILGNKDMVDDVGNWTDEGVTSLGLYAQQMEVAEVQAKKYQEAIEYLNNNWKQLGYTEQEYIEKLDELKNGQYDSIKAYHDAKDAIVDLNKERIDAIKECIEKEIDAYSELIKKKKELLDSEKDLYDFQKSIMKQEKNIADIERQLAALAGDNSASARAKKAQLEAELAEAQSELADSYYDRSVQDQQEALDKELENFQEEKEKEMEALDEYLEKTEQVVSDSLTTIQANTDVVYKTLTAMGKEYGLSISECLTSPWKEGELAIQSFSEQFGISMSATVAELEALEQTFKRVMNEIEQSGVNATNTVANNANKYTAAESKVPQNSTSTVVKPESTQVQEETKPSLTKGSYVEVKPGTRWYSTSAGTGASGTAKSGNIKYINEGSSHPYNINGGGWVRKQDIQGYAKGTKDLKKSGIVNVDELGEELILGAQNGRLTYLEKGSGVIPADLTSNLMEWGKLDPSIMLDANRPKVDVSPEIHNTEIKLDCSVGTLLHIDEFNGDKPEDIAKLVSKEFEKHTKNLNNALKKYTR